MHAYFTTRAPLFPGKKAANSFYAGFFLVTPPKNAVEAGLQDRAIGQSASQNKRRRREAEILTRQRWAKREQFKLRKNPDSFANTVNGRMDSPYESIRPPVQEA